MFDMWSSKYVSAKIDKRLQYYLIGCFFGCILLAILPKPFNVNRSATGGRSSSLNIDYPFIYTDGYQRTIELDDPPKRIISLAPGITEIVYDINASEYLVANTLDCKYPKEARNLPKVGSSVRSNYENILQYKPDLILGDLLRPSLEYKQMADLGLTAIAMQQNHLDVILHDILIVGKLLGQLDTAMQLVLKIKTQRDLIIERISLLEKSKPVRVIFLYDLEQLEIVQSDLWIKEFVTLCQAINITDEISEETSPLTLRLREGSNPDVIILALSLENKALFKKEGKIDEISNYSVWKNSNAVRHNQIITIDKDLLSSSGLRMIVAMNAIARAIHPEISLAF